MDRFISVLATWQAHTLRVFSRLAVDKRQTLGAEVTSLVHTDGSGQTCWAWILPPHVKDLVLQAGESSARNNCIWFGRT